MFTRTATVALLVALAGTTAATGATRTGGETAAPAKSMQTARSKPGTVRPPLPSATTVVAISAFPTGGKGSGTEATCELWSNQLAADEQALDEASDKQDIIDASNNLNADVDNALDAGCVVIYSAAAPQMTGIRTTAIAAAGRGFTKTTFTPAQSVAYISAFPTGGKGSATEATCALWTKALQEDQEIIDNAPDTDKQDAAGPLEADIDNALDAGCAVIY
jgi:hypothetical protein